jgi:hypothetical protein
MTELPLQGMRCRVMTKYRYNKTAGMAILKKVMTPTGRVRYFTKEPDDPKITAAAIILK